MTDARGPFYDSFDATGELDYPEIRDADELVDCRLFGYVDEDEADDR